MNIALYARVSTDGQDPESTIRRRLKEAQHDAA